MRVALPQVTRAGGRREHVGRDTGLLHGVDSCWGNARACHLRSLVETEPGVPSQKGLTGFRCWVQLYQNCRSRGDISEACEEMGLKEALRHHPPEEEESNFIKREKER